MINTLLLVLFLTSLVILINVIGHKLLKSIPIAKYTGTILSLTGACLLMVMARLDAEGMKQLAYAAVGTLILISGVVSWFATFFMHRYLKKKMDS